MSRRTTYWRRLKVRGDSPGATASNILASASHSFTKHPDTGKKVHCPMNPEKAARIAGSLHRKLR